MTRQAIQLLAVAVAFSMAAFAGPVTWTVTGTFDDGGVMSGFFVFDADVMPPPFPDLSDWDISTTGGDTAVFFPFDFTPANSLAGYDPTTQRLGMHSNATFQLLPPPNFAQFLELSLVLTSPLTDAGGAVSVDLTNPFTDECFNCVPFRTLTSASVSSPVPEPSSIVLLGGCVIILTVRARRRGGDRLLQAPGSRVRRFCRKRW
jgi:hypothetical protein